MCSHRHVLGGIVALAMLLALSVYAATHVPALTLLGQVQPYLVDQLQSLARTLVRECRAACVPELAAGGGTVASVSSLLLVLTGVAAAWPVATAFTGTAFERPLVFGLVALAYISSPAAFVGWGASWSGTHLLRPPVGPLLCMLPALVGLTVAARRGWRPRLPRATLRPRGLLLPIVVGLAMALLVASMALGVLYPVTGYDALAVFAPLGIFLWRGGDLSSFFAQAPDYWPLAHPGTAQLWFGLLAGIGGERLADLGQLPFAFLGAAGVHAMARRLGLRAGSATLAGAAFLLTPLVIAQSRMQLDDVIGASLLIATAALAAAPILAWHTDRLRLFGLGLGLVATTRLSQLPAVAVVGLFAAAVVVWPGPRRGRSRAVITHLVALGVPFALVVAPWWIRNAATFGNPLYPAVLPIVGRGISQADFPLKDMEFVRGADIWAWAQYPLIEPHNEVSGFGALFVVAALPGIAVALVRARRQPILLYGLTVLAMLPAWWLMTQHEPRFLLGIVGMTYAFLPWSLFAIKRPSRVWGAAIICMAAAFSGVVTLADALLVNVFEPNARSAFYDHDWAVDPQVASLPENEGVLLNTGYSWIDYATLYALLGPTLGRSVAVANAGTSEDIAAAMQRAQVRYVYVIASASAQPAIEAKFGRPPFVLTRTSSVSIRDEPLRRSLYQLE